MKKTDENAVLTRCREERSAVASSLGFGRAPIFSFSLDDPLLPVFFSCLQGAGSVEKRV